MTAAWMWARSRLRHRWRSLLVIAVVAGIGGGVAVTAATGSVRAATAFDRFNEVTLGPDVLISPDAEPQDLEDLESLPGVAAGGYFTYTPVAPVPLVPAEDAGAFVAFNESLFTTIYRPRILEGRRPRPGATDEVTVNQSLADAADLHAGERVRLRGGFDPSDLASLGDATVVGIHVGGFDLGANGGQPSMLLNSAFYEAHQEDIELGAQPAGMARLRGGSAGVDAFNRAIRQVYGPGVVAITADQEEGAVKDTLDVQAVGLGLLAAAAALATLIAVLQAEARMLRSEQDDLVVLRSLGLRRRDVVGGGAIIGLSVGVVAVAIASVIGILGSAKVPTGTAARFEVPGIRPEPLVVIAGAAVLLTASLAGSGFFALRSATRRAEPSRSRPAPGAGPLSVRLGIHWALTRTGASAATASARAAIVAVTVGLAGLAAVVTFALSMQHLITTDRLYGWDFNASLSSFDAKENPLPETAAALVDDKRVEGLAWAWVFDAPTEDGGIEVLALDPVRGGVHPSLLSGRAPAAPDEVALGAEAMERNRVGLGDQLRLGGGELFRVVGKAVFPELGNNSDLANLASMTVAGMRRLDGEPLQSIALLHVREGVDPEAVLEPYVQDGEAEIVLPFRPPRVRNFEEVGALPWLMAGFLGLLATMAVGHALALSVRGRRRDLAVLRAFGAIRRQLAGAVWAQATATVAVGAIGGIPIGIAVGRWSWSAVASGLGVVDQPVLAVLALAAVAMGVLAMANIVATGPAWAAARLRPAAILRSE